MKMLISFLHDTFAFVWKRNIEFNLLSFFLIFHILDPSKTVFINFDNMRVNNFMQWITDEKQNKVIQSILIDVDLKEKGKIKREREREREKKKKKELNTFA